jgi:SAM-dependent methyltransferase
MGRCGNQLFQYASLIGLSKKYGCDVKLPRWKYSQFFQHPPDQIDYIAVDKLVEEPHYHYEQEFWERHNEDFKSKTVDILGWLQSEKFFQDSKDEVDRRFKFTQDVIESVRLKVNKSMFDKPVIAISVRRGDFVDNPNHYLLPINYYIGALMKCFPDFREQYNIMMFSDDLNFCKLHFQCLQNVFYADGLSAIEQLCLGSFCHGAIISNSTFSWWMAWLMERRLGAVTIVRPNFVFDGEQARTHSDKDYWPDRWTVFDHKIMDNRIDLSDVTFTIPVNYDSPDRRQNVDLSIKMLLHQFKTNIIIGEQGAIKRFDYTGDLVKYVHFSEMKVFHRTKMLNDMASMAKTPIIANWDADVFVSPVQLIEAVESIRRHESDGVYPYDGRFARVPRRLYKQILNKLDIGILSGQHFEGMESIASKSVGGGVIWDRQSFIRGGMENENMINYGPEDAERFDRFTALGFKIRRVGGVMYHIDHIKGTNSSVTHPHFVSNESELDKIRLMSADQLRNYVSRWPWAQRYDASYYGGILEESVRSRDVVLNLLKRMGIPMQSVVDFGCGLGHWGRDFYSKFGGMYLGVDFEVPMDQLVIPKEYYQEHDLRTPFMSDTTFTSDGKYELVLCLEVAEHIDETYADQLVDTLCRVGKYILFSAAIPGQGGVNHVNEQWQSYWSKKFWDRGLFLHKTDIRREIYNDSDVAVWYRQNLMLFTMDHQDSYDGGYKPDFVHPDMYMNLMKHHGIIKT